MASTNPYKGFNPHKDLLSDHKLALISILTQPPIPIDCPPFRLSVYCLPFNHLPLGDDRDAIKFLVSSMAPSPEGRKREELTVGVQQNVYDRIGAFIPSFIGVDGERNVFFRCEGLGLVRVLRVDAEAAQIFLQKHAPGATFLGAKIQEPDIPKAETEQSMGYESVSIEEDLCLDIEDWDLVGKDEEWVAL